MRILEYKHNPSVFTSTVIVLLIVIVLTACDFGSSESQVLENPLVVFAAASLTDVLNEVGESFMQETGTAATFNFAGSNVLAQQILAAPKADIFFSASEYWMDAVANADRIQSDSRRAVLSNSLVVIGHPGFQGTINQPADLCELSFRFLALGNPDAVPAGRYAREWMQSAEHDGRTVWECVEDHVSPTPDVRSALGQVEANPDVLGIVYRTDYMAATNRVELLFEVPVEDGPRIGYSVARLKDSTRSVAAQQFLDFLNSETARSIFAKHGFLVTNPAPTTAESVE